MVETKTGLMKEIERLEGGDGKKENLFTIGVKHGRKIRNEDVPRNVVLAMMNSIKLDREIKERQAKMKEYKKVIEEHVKLIDIGDVSTITLNYNGFGVKLTFKDKVVISDVPALMELLDKHFLTLVNVKESYNPDKKLIEMAADADFEMLGELLGLEGDEVRPFGKKLRKLLKRKKMATGFKFIIE
jgi:hypothetical protein